jgi:3-hydroxyisobutyrate dehydrogenase-like beta-hydroxyacid dehydrogenase
MHKDLDAALELGKSVKIPLPLVELTQAKGRETTGLQ